MLKKLFLVCSFTMVAISVAMPAYAVDAKIVFVNFTKALDDSPQAIAANKRLEIEFAPRKNELNDLRKKYRSYEDRLTQENLQMSPAQLRKLERNVRDTKREIRRAQEDYREDLNIRRNEELRKLQIRVKRAINVVAKKKNYDLVVGEGVFYSSGRVDITDEILAVLADEFKSAPTAAPVGKTPKPKNAK